MGGGRGFVAALGLAAGIVWAGAAAGGAAEAKEPGVAGEQLGAVIERAIKGEGPFFTAEERAVIERKCGYAPGSWDGFEANMSDGAFRCRDGRRVDDAEMRALLAVAQPRIERRIEAAMESPEVKAAFEELHRKVETATRRALDEAKVAEKAAAEAAHAVERAMADSRRALEQSRRAIEEARRARR
jgi:hypothetical protein